MDYNSNTVLYFLTSLISIELRIFVLLI